MPVIPNLPPAPDRRNPDEFADVGDAFLGALPAWGAAANALGNQVSADAAATATATAQAKAASAAALAAANYRGDWAAGTAYATGQSVSYGATVWAAKRASTGVVPTSGANWLRVDPGVPVVAYDDRATLRAATPANGDKTVVSGLGLFVFYTGIAETDDDETCFATAAGRWVLEAASFELVTALMESAESLQDTRLSAQEARLGAVESGLEGKVLRGSVTTTITSVASVGQISQPVTVPGAAVGDVAAVSPPGALDARLAVYASVTAKDVVTIYISNASASTAPLTNPTAWAVAVLKG